MNRLTRIYHAADLAIDKNYSLDEKASHHLVRVLRLKPGQKFIVFNGLGSAEYLTELVSIDKKSAEVKTLECLTKHVESPLKIYLGQAISRGERMDYTLQKSVELGVYEITPLFTERCGVDLKGDRLEKRVAHWQQVVISACEQSGRCYVPQVKTPQTLETWMQSLQVDLALVADPKSTKSLRDFSTCIDRVALLCGSEGGLSDSELNLAQHYKTEGFSLGPRILRTETAALTAISLMQERWGDLSL